MRKNSGVRVNHQIGSRRVIVINSEGQKLGEFLKPDAINLAEEEGLDLVEVGDSDGKTICRIMDYGKFLYDQKKKQKRNRTASSSSKVKEIRLGANTDDNDSRFFVERARKFLADGCKVKVCVRTRNKRKRFRYPTELAFEKCESFFGNLDDIANVESKPRMVGSNVTMILSPK